MGHEWIFDVLADLRNYALRNGLPELASQVDAAARVARAEIRAAERGDTSGGTGGGEGGAPPPGGWRN